MVQKLIERLLNEAKTEAAHKGFCDENVKTAMKDRDYRYKDVEELHVRLGDLSSTKNRLQREIKELKKDIKDLEETLDEANKLRDEEKAENIKTLLQAKKAVSAVKDAIKILKIFYARAKNTGFQGAKPGEILTALQVDDPSFNKGTNRGNQDRGNAVIDEMEDLRKNFQDKINTVTREEKEATEEHVEFSRESKADIAGKETKLERNEQDLEETVNRMDQAIKDLDSQQGLLDKALKELKDIKPMCFSNGMSFEERKKKRKEEQAALEMVLCILDPNGKEEDCKKED
jgi:chromosome segregation ATPase